MKQPIDNNYIQLIDGVVEFNYDFTEFLPARSAHFLRVMLKCPAIIVDSFIYP
jgi:hypothetical protein